MRRIGFLFLVYVAFASCAKEQPVETPAAGKKPLRIARYYWPGMYWIDIAAEKGWFAEAGLPVELIDTNPDYYAGLKGVVNGTIDVNTYYLFDAALFNARGSDLVAFLESDVDTGATGIVVNRDVRHLRSLKGKKVAVSRGTFLEYLLTVALEREGLTPADVEVVDGQPENALSDLAKPEIKGVVTWEPLLSQAEEKGHLRAFDTAHIIGVAPAVVATRRDVLRERPDDLKALCRVWLKTTAFIQSDPQAAYAIIARIYGKTPQEVAEFTRRDTIRDLAGNLTAFTSGPGFDSLYGAAESVNRHLADSGVIERPLDTARMFDDRFVRQLEKESAGR